jgi:hypothetical protein
MHDIGTIVWLILVIIGVVSSIRQQMRRSQQPVQSAPAAAPTALPPDFVLPPVIAPVPAPVPAPSPTPAAMPPIAARRARPQQPAPAAATAISSVPVTGTSPIRGMFQRGSLVRAIIAAEVLGAPKAQQEQTIWSPRHSEPSI